MLKKIYTSATNLLDDDVFASEVLFIIVGFSFLAFANFAANVPVLGPVPHRALNYLSSFTAFIFFLLIVLTKWGKTNWHLLLTVFIYEFNFINVYLLYGTEHMDMYAYQFIVGYVISSYFFKTKISLRYFAVIINMAVILAAFTSHAKSTSPFDFYMTYAVSQGVFGVLYRYRFGVEERLMESEKKYRLLAENSFDLICIHSVKAKLEFVSPSSKRLLGYAPEEITGHYPISLVHPDDSHIMKSLDFRDPAHPFMDRPVQFRLRNSKGEYIWFETIFTLMDGSNGESNFVLSQSRDIRRSKKYQMELEERSRELERSNSDLETFAFVSSHDMQEPLRMISNYTQLLRKRYEGKLDKDADEYIDFANKGALSLHYLIRDLLSYSRITRAEIKKSPINMNGLVNELLRTLKLQLDERNAKVHVGDLADVDADRSLIMLVMQNLVLNGAKYNRSGNPEITISCEVGKRETTFCITDNGIGIEEKYQQRIFEPFRRLHTKAEYPGTGLGLSICKKIVERLGGRIWVDSEPGQGSRFFFTLPLR